MYTLVNLNQYFYIVNLHFRFSWEELRGISIYMYYTYMYCHVLPTPGSLYYQSCNSFFSTIRTLRCAEQPA